MQAPEKSGRIYRIAESIDKRFSELLVTQSQKGGGTECELLGRLAAILQHAEQATPDEEVDLLPYIASLRRLTEETSDFVAAVDGMASRMSKRHAVWDHRPVSFCPRCGGWGCVNGFIVSK